MKNFENAMEAIGQAIHHHDLTPNSNPEVHAVLGALDEAYVLVPWPESQEYMEESWFNTEAILNVDQSSAYFIPLKRII